MRLSPVHQAIIKTEALRVFGDNADVFLFGSRVDDSKKGGDIDLFIRMADKDGLFGKKIRFLARLKRQIGEQSIDVVFNEGEDRLIEQEVRKWSVQLYFIKPNSKKPCTKPLYTWQELMNGFFLREIRNNIAHDYEDNRDQARLILNNIYQYRGELRQILVEIEQKNRCSNG